jgi:hypothetical protein
MCLWGVWSCHPHRSTITQWEPRHPEPLLAWFDAWSPLLPRGACQTLLQGLVMPRIAAAVEAWDPTRETQPIHAWLHPWLPYLAPELVSVYPTIRCVAESLMLKSRSAHCVCAEGGDVSVGPFVAGPCTHLFGSHIKQLLSVHIQQSRCMHRTSPVPLSC